MHGADQNKYRIRGMAVGPALAAISDTKTRFMILNRSDSSMRSAL
jgi:hypothetical protein